ncbi:cryptochrome/photolyase family protein [Pengzhenrongella frigida]|uniref:Deoxyribodipyrimidine photo-lyase n=1 Tax=Pengzhenrongella frigida TaxID=1259133 RepID=A0A4V1ZHD6_9MICO|nr:deoxyribodipyrimidine photo-lyase [Cellulomonas sp. HLT2-17]RYV51674.1 deoxyribodipyrimidine photo-lyase [Cellulomonas sp. HLT2-17]
MAPTIDRALVWFRRDLRSTDNAALHRALLAAREVWCVFVFDRDILDSLPSRDRRVEFIHDSLVELDRDLADLGDDHGRAGVRLLVVHDSAIDAVPALARALDVRAVYANHDDEPASLARDAAVADALERTGIALRTSKDHVVFERSEVLTLAGKPYSVFTPYKNAWLKQLEPHVLEAYPVAPHAAALAPVPPVADLPAGVTAGPPALESLGFERTNLHELRVPTGASGAQHLLADFLDRIGDYEDTRNFPAVKGPSYLSVHLRFGTVSIRELVRVAWERTGPGPAARGAQVWLSELIWRDFYHQILHHHPRVVSRSFKPEYDGVVWETGPHADELFTAWCEGRTGYPLVDAAMAQINQTGYMHNRLRMVVASFLTKDLGLDWRRGERYFARQLIDFDLAANNGGWQWAASTGCDAQPYFRIFNPVSQSQKFDPDGTFIRRYLPQLAALPTSSIHAPWAAPPMELLAVGVELGRDYPEPVVDHAEARLRTLARYGVVKAP